LTKEDHLTKFIRNKAVLLKVSLSLEKYE